MALTPWAEALSSTRGTSSGGPTPKGMHSNDQYGPHDWLGRGNKQVSNSGSGWDWGGENANLYMQADKILEETGVDPLQRLSGDGWKDLLGLGLFETGAGMIGSGYSSLTGKQPWSMFTYPPSSPKVPKSTGFMSKIFPATILAGLGYEIYDSSFQPEFDPNDPMFDKYR